MLSKIQTLFIQEIATENIVKMVAILFPIIVYIYILAIRGEIYP